MRAEPASTVPVWDRAVRVLHWTLVVSVALSAFGLVALFRVHRPAGYVVLAALGLRQRENLVAAMVSGASACPQNATSHERSPRAVSTQ